MKPIRSQRDWDIPRSRDRWKDCKGNATCEDFQARADQRWQKPNAQAEAAVLQHKLKMNHVVNGEKRITKGRYLTLERDLQRNRPVRSMQTGVEPKIHRGRNAAQIRAANRAAKQARRDRAKAQIEAKELERKRRPLPFTRLNNIRKVRAAAALKRAQRVPAQLQEAAPPPAPARPAQRQNARAKSVYRTPAQMAAIQAQIVAAEAGRAAQIEAAEAGRVADGFFA